MDSDLDGSRTAGTGYNNTRGTGLTSNGGAGAGAGAGYTTTGATGGTNAGPHGSNIANKLVSTLQPILFSLPGLYMGFTFKEILGVVACLAPIE